MNAPEDVLLVQRLLNANRHLMIGAREIAEDRVLDPKTIEVILKFQREVIRLKVPDGRIDPDGRTFQALVAPPRAVAEPPAPAPTLIKVISTLVFPLRKRPTASYKSGAREVGARRDGGKRRHAGCDLLASPGTPILAMDDGEVNADPYYFYSGTNALEIRHADGWIARYGEISGAAAGLKRGSQVKRGQVIAYVGQLGSGRSMLHLEFYTGSGSGNLTVRGNRPFQRRSDLADPTEFLDAAVLA